MLKMLWNTKNLPGGGGGGGGAGGPEPGIGGGGGGGGGGGAGGPVKEVSRKISVSNQSDSIDSTCGSTVWKLRKFSHTLFCQKFRDNNSFTREVTKELISRNIFSVSERDFPVSQCGKNEKFSLTRKYFVKSTL